MKVFHIGITASTYSSEGISESFKEVFGDTRYFHWQNHRFNYGTEAMRSNAILEAETYSPDIIFIHCNNNSEAFDVATYKRFSELAYTIVYTEDVRKDITWFETLCPLVNLTIFTNLDDVETLWGKGIKNVIHQPVSYNHIWYKKQPKTERNYGDIVFIGNNHVDTNLDFPNAQQRVETIAALKKEFGDKFQAYGLGQENKMLNPQEAVECYSNAKIAIGHNNFTRKGYQSDRCLNAMGCGCATLMQHYEGIEKDFPNINSWSWRSIDELIALCKLYLKLESGELYLENNLSSYLYKTTTEKHRWVNRCNEIKEYINK